MKKQKNYNNETDRTIRKMKQRKMKTTYAFRFVGLSVKIKVDAILGWLEKEKACG